MKKKFRVLTASVFLPPPGPPQSPEHRPNVEAPIGSIIELYDGTHARILRRSDQIERVADDSEVTFTPSA